MRNSKKIIIGVLCCLLIFMGVGFAYLSTTLSIEGTAKVTGKFDIEITDISINQKTDGASSVSYSVNSEDVTKASFETNLKAPGDYIEYIVTVENKGTIDADLDSTTTGFEEYDDDYFTYTYGTYIDGTFVESDLSEISSLGTASSGTFIVRVEFSDVTSLPTEDDYSVAATLNIAFNQSV